MYRLYSMLSFVLVLVLSVMLIPAYQVDAASGSVAPTRGMPGTTFTFTVTGYSSGEQLGYWLVDPKGNTIDPDTNLFADSNGQAVWTWNATADMPGGIFQMMVRGYRGEREVVTIPFRLDAPETPPSAVPSYMVLPDNHGSPGTTFTFVSRGGFEPHEQVGTWMIQPDGSQLFLDSDISSDGDGQIYKVWTAPDDARGGDWYFRAQGRNSMHHVSIPFHIDNPSDVIENPANIRANPTIEAAVIAPPTHKVSPEQGSRGTTFTFEADGFMPGERVGTWTVRPDGTVPESFDDYIFASDQPNGFVTWTWTAPADAIPGVWTMVIRGVHSRVEWEIPFTIVGEEIAPTPVPQVALSVSPTSAPAGTSFTFTANGYQPKEAIYFWAIDPLGDPEPNKRELQADGNGSVTWEWKVEADRQPGTWTMYIRGGAAWQETSVLFDVTGSVSNEIRMEPTIGGPGTTFQFTASGFYADEEMDFWLTGPQGGIRRFDQNYDLVERKQYTDMSGNVWWTWTAPDNVQAGRWAMTARGEESRIERIISFEITRPESLKQPYNVTPASGSPGTTFQFTIEDMPTSLAAYWVTAPDGTIFPRDPSQYRHWRILVDDTGTATWSWTAPPDAQPGTWMMVVRNLSDNLLLRPPKDKADIPRYEEDLKDHEEDIRDQAIEFREYLIYFTIE